MRPAHIALAVLVAAVWGFNFVAIKVGLRDFPPLLFCVLRFVLAATPLLVLGVRGGPPVAWRHVLAIGLVLGALQFALLFTGLSVIDNIYLACAGVSRGRFSMIRPRRNDALMQSAEQLAAAVHLLDVRGTKVAELSYGQQRQLEIALALAGAPRFILFDEPAAGLSPTERRELIEILTNLPPHIGYIIIEHDMDVALRVAEQVTMMHDGRVIVEGTPDQIRANELVHDLYLGRGYRNE